MVAGCGEVRDVMNTGQLVEQEGVRTSTASDDVVADPTGQAIAVRPAKERLITSALNQRICER